jgi:hypothetical protein
MYHTLDMEDQSMYPKGTLANWLDDRIVYRNLVPCDLSLPSLQDVWQEVGLEDYRVPRKTEPAYAAAVFRFLEAAQAARGGPPLSYLLFIGDTHMNDGTAARNLGAHLPLRGFIGADRLGEREEVKVDGILMVANRWRRLADFPDWVRNEGLVCDEQTAVLIDIDKTFIGARGRNDRVIDGARVAAVHQTVEELLGGGFDEAGFCAVYDELNKQEYHYFTGDNQDYLAYICLMVVGDVFPADELWKELSAGRLTGFTQFVTLCDARRQRMQEGLALAHREVTVNVRQGDPTPFKSFRYREYFTTVGRMDCLPDDAPENELLASEILITGEVAQVAQQLSEKGVLTFGISDKPDEASLPPKSLAQEGAQPIHRARMKVFG